MLKMKDDEEVERVSKLQRFKRRVKGIRSKKQVPQ